jgi:hypothetical protein
MNNRGNDDVQGYCCNNVIRGNCCEPTTNSFVIVIVLAMILVSFILTAHFNNDLFFDCWVKMPLNNDSYYAGCLVLGKNEADRETGVYRYIRLSFPDARAWGQLVVAKQLITLMLGIQMLHKCVQNLVPAVSIFCPAAGKSVAPQFTEWNGSALNRMFWLNGNSGGISAGDTTIFFFSKPGTVQNGRDFYYWRYQRTKIVRTHKARYLDHIFEWLKIISYRPTRIYFFFVVIRVYNTNSMSEMRYWQNFPNNTVSHPWFPCFATRWLCVEAAD